MGSVGVMQIIGLCLIAFVCGALLREWLLKWGDYISARVSEQVRKLSSLRREHEQALQRIQSMEEVIQMLEADRHHLRAIISHDLVPKIQMLEEKVGEAYKKLEWYVEELKLWQKRKKRQHGSRI